VEAEQRNVKLISTVIQTVNKWGYDEPGTRL